MGETAALGFVYLQGLSVLVEISVLSPLHLRDVIRPLGGSKKAWELHLSLVQRTGSGASNAPPYYIKIFYYKIVSV